MPRKGTGKILVHILLLVLQLTLLQWSMQEVLALPNVPGQTHDCLHDTGTEPTGSPSLSTRHCCPDRMSLDCQYHCSAGGFGFLVSATASLSVSLDRAAFAEPEAHPDILTLRNLFRPPRRLLA